jgi:DNA-nicking Smr family endonuclease
MTRRLSSEERRLWSRVARTVRPVSGRVAETEPEEVEVKSAGGPFVAAKAERAGEAAKRPHRPGPPEDLSGQRRIRRGQMEIEARLDLHGHTQDTAHRELIDFIVHEAASGARCVLVITGKGRLGAGILRSRLHDWIGDPGLRPIIAGHATAHARHGGEGATYIFLRQPLRSR